VSNDQGRVPPDPLSTAPEDPGGLGPEARQLNWMERWDVAQKSAGILAPVLTALLAFFVGGIIVLITTGKNPLSTYRAIFEGSGLNYLLPWISSEDRFLAELNLQQTLLIMTPLILTGLAVAFAFRCGMFNIGGQGQYFVGAYFAVWIGSSFAEMNSFVHIMLAAVVATLAGAVWAGIAGLLKATVGVHEVISTIMLNWIAIWVGQFLFGLNGPLQNDTQESVPISNDIVEGAKLPVFWGDPLLQGLSIGIFVSLAALVLYWILLNRTSLGYSVRAVGFNPEAARYGGINVSRNYFLAMAISGAFAGLAGALDILGWQFRISTSDIQTSTIGFIGIAVALLGRNTAVGVGLSALLFAALVNGTSTRNLDPEIFQPELASNLTLLIQGLVVLFVGADIIVLTLLNKLRRARGPDEPARPAQTPPPMSTPA
jgi:simple sugar transport system permease protein